MTNGLVYKLIFTLTFPMVPQRGKGSVLTIFETIYL